MPQPHPQKGTHPPSEGKREGGGGGGEANAQITHKTPESGSEVIDRG